MRRSEKIGELLGVTKQSHAWERENRAALNSGAHRFRLPDPEKVIEFWVVNRQLNSGEIVFSRLELGSPVKSETLVICDNLGSNFVFYYKHDTENGQAKIKSAGYFGLDNRPLLRVLRGYGQVSDTFEEVDVFSNANRMLEDLKVSEPHL